MSDIKIDSITGDIELIGVDLGLTTGVEAIQQHLSQRMKTFLGEWFLDKRIGIAYLQQIFKKNPDPIVVDSILKKQIVNTPGVKELTRFVIDIGKDRVMTLTFSVKTTDGVINFSEVIP